MPQACQRRMARNPRRGAPCVGKYTFGAGRVPVAHPGANRPQFQTFGGAAGLQSSAVQSSPAPCVTQGAGGFFGRVPDYSARPHSLIFWSSVL